MSTTSGRLRNKRPKEQESETDRQRKQGSAREEEISKRVVKARIAAGAAESKDRDEIHDRAYKGEERRCVKINGEAGGIPGEWNARR